MALTKCKECGHEVSNQAKTCPQCGAPMPKRTSLVTWLVAGLLGLVFINWIVSPSSDKPSPQAKATQPSDAECSKTLECWGERHFAAATVRCQSAVERLAKFSFKWTDGFLEPKFSHYRWKSQKTGVVTYIGDKIQFQNGFGAWQNSMYECDFDTYSGRVLDARAGAGRL